MSRRIHGIRGRNSACLDDLLKLAVTAKDVGEFERKLGEIGMKIGFGQLCEV